MATKRFIGTATDIKQVNTYTVANTWAADDTILITIGGGTMTITIGADVATTDIAAILSAAINASTNSITAYTDVVLTIGGQQIPELTEVVATVSGSVVTVTSKAAGVPFAGTLFPSGLTIAETTAGTGDITDAEATTATGRNWFTNAENWDTGVAPVNSDVLIFSDLDVDCLYGIEAAAELTGLEYQIDASYTAAIGLASRNPAGYEEWRPRYLKHEPATGASNKSTVRIGQGDGVGSSRINLDFATATPTVLILKSASPESGASVAVSIIGGATGTKINANRGIIGIAEDGVSTATCDLIMGYVAGQASDAQVLVGRQADVETVAKGGGILSIEIASGTIDSLDQERGDSGEVTIGGEVAVTALTVNGGVCVANTAGVIATVTLGGDGAIDYSHDNRTKTITNAVERNSEDSTFLDPHGVITSLILDYNNVNPANTQDDLGQNIRVTRGAVA